MGVNFYWPIAQKYMGPISDSNSEHVAHVWRKIGLIGEKYHICDHALKLNKCHAIYSIEQKCFICKCKMAVNLGSIAV